MGIDQYYENVTDLLRKCYETTINGKLGSQLSTPSRANIKYHVGTKRDIFS